MTDHQHLLEINRKAYRELAGVAEATPADYAHIYEARQLLQEQMHLIMQSAQEGGGDEALPASVEAKRRRGGQRQYYIADAERRRAFVERMARVISASYRGARRFELPDGMLVGAAPLLASLYYLGIKLGEATPEAPVKDYYSLLMAAVEGVDSIDFYISYKTLQGETCGCRTYMSAADLYNRDIRLHEIDPEKVRPECRKSYEADMQLLSQVEEMWNR